MADDFDLNTAQDVTPAAPVAAPDDGGFDVSTAQDVNAPTETALHQESGKVVQMPAGLDGHEADYLAKTQVQGRNPADFYGVLDMGMGFAKKVGHLAYQATTPVSWEFDKENKLRDVVNASPELVRGAADFAATAIPQMLGSNMQEGGEREAQDQPQASKQVLGVVDSLPLPDAVKGFFHEAYGAQGNQLASDVADFSTSAGKALRDSNAKWASDHGLDRPKDDTAGVMYDVGSGAASTGVSLGMAMMARNPEAAAVFFGGMQKGDTYQEARAAGKDPDTAGKISTLNGTVNGVLEGLGNKIFADVAHATTSPFRKVIASMLEEGGQEGAQQIADETISGESGIRTTDMQTKLEAIAYATAIGAVVGAGASTVEQIGSKVAEQHGLDPAVGQQVAAQMTAGKQGLTSALQQTINQGVAGVAADPKAAGQTAQIVKDFQTGKDIAVPDGLKADITPQATALESNLKAQLTAAGQGEEEASTNAGLTRAAYESLSKRYPGLQDQIDTAFKGLSVGTQDGEGTFNQAANVTATPEFKNWFGESQVKDDKGAPLKVYHGTFGDFEAFVTNQGTSERAAFFTPDPKIASVFADPIEFGVGDEAKPNVVPVFLSIRNPLTIDAKEVMLDGEHSFDSMRTVVLRARREGYDGLHIINVPDGYGVSNQWAAFNPTQIKSIFNRGTFDPNDPRILYQGGKRGSIKLSNGMAAINLFKAADASTFLHETGHFYWDTLDKLAADPKAPAQLRNDVQTIRDFVGAKGNAPLTVEQEEQRTRAVEAYLMEGRSPSTRLAPVFERFRKWLQDVYKSVKALKVNITPEVRAVLDRVFATDEEMEASRHRALDLEKVGRVRYLDKQVGALDEQIDALDQVMQEREQDGKPNVANQKALERLLQQRDALDEERAHILTGEGEKQAMEFDTRPIELRAGDVQKLVGDERRRALEQGLREGRKMARENLKEAQDFLLNVINQSGLQAADKAKFLATLKNIQTTEQLDKVLSLVQSRISTLLEAQARREVKAKIISLLDKAKARKSGGKPQGRFTPDIQDSLDQLRAASKMGVGEAQAKLEANLANENPTPEMAMENRVLQAIAGDNSASMKETLAGIQDLLAEGKAGATDRMLERAERIANLRMYTLTAVSSGEDRSMVDRTKLSERLGQIIRDARGEIYRGQNSFTDLLNLITGADKTGAKDAVLEGLGYQLSDAWRVREGVARRATEYSTDKMMKAFGFTRPGQMVAQFGTDSHLVDLGTFTDTSGTSVRMQMTKAQARKRWMEMQDPTLMETITAPNGNGYTPAMINAVDQFLTPQDKAFAQAQMEFYRWFYPQINEVYSGVYGVNLPSNPNYSPISRRHKKEAEADTFHGELGFRMSAAPGGLKSRVNTKSPLKEMNDFAVLQRHIGEMAHFIALQNKVQELSSVFNNNDIRDQIADRYGKVVLATFDDYIQDFARGQMKVLRDGLGWFETMRQNFSASVLGAKPALALKQMAAFVAYGENIPTADFTKGFAEMLANPMKAARVLNDSEMMKAREANLERDIMLAEKSANLGNFRTVKKIRNAMYWFVQAGDRASLVMGGYPVYLYHKNALGKSHQEALQAFERATARAQQMSDLDQLSRLQASGSVGSRLLTMFGSGQNQFYRRETQAFLDYKRGTISGADLTKRVLVYHFIAPMLFQFVADFFRFDPENQARAAIFGSLNGFFVGYQLLDTLLRKIMATEAVHDLINPDGPKDKPMTNGGVASSVGEFASKILDGVIKLSDADGDTDQMSEAFNKIASGLGELTGFPFGRLSDLAQSLQDFGNGDNASGTALVGGWPRSVAKQIRSGEEDF